MICIPSFLSSIKAKTNFSVSLPNGTTTSVTYIGTPRITDKLILKDVLCVLSFSFNFISIKKFAQELNSCVIFLLNVCFIQDLSTWTTIQMGEAKSGLYQVLPLVTLPMDLQETLNHITSTPSLAASAMNRKNEFDIWHYRMGHPSHSKLASQNNPSSVCPLAKLHMLPFPVSQHKSEKCFDLIHCDIWGPCNKML